MCYIDVDQTPFQLGESCLSPLCVRAIQVRSRQIFYIAYPLKFQALLPTIRPWKKPHSIFVPLEIFHLPPIKFPPIFHEYNPRFHFQHRGKQTIPHLHLYRLSGLRWAGLPKFKPTSQPHCSHKSARPLYKATHPKESQHEKTRSSLVNKSPHSSPNLPASNPNSTVCPNTRYNLDFVCIIILLFPYHHCVFMSGRGIQENHNERHSSRFK